MTFGEGEAVVRQLLGGGEGALVLRGVKLQVGPALVRWEGGRRDWGREQPPWRREGWGGSEGHASQLSGS